MIIFEHPYYTFHIEEQTNVLRFNWEEAHSDMSYEDFKEACSNYAGYAIEHQSLYLLVDTRDFSFEVPASFLEWREKNHHPRFYKLGVKKMAYLMPVQVLAHMQDIPSEAGKFATRYFSTEAAALAWLSKKA